MTEEVGQPFAQATGRQSGQRRAPSGAGAIGSLVGSGRDTSGMRGIFGPDQTFLCTSSAHRQ
ncbi:MAG: hypothetical protein WBV74_13400, partial [Pseudonocardiaceae bacterium]